MILQFAGNSVAGADFGAVQTADGEGWSYSANFEGTVDGGRLRLSRAIRVDGDQQNDTATWRMSGVDLEIDETRYQPTDCATVWTEFAALGLDDATQLLPANVEPGRIFSHALSLTHEVTGFEPHELAFATPQDGVARAEFASDDFYAVILASAERCAFTERDRVEAQGVFPDNKVFIDRFLCDDHRAEAISYTNVASDWAFIAVHAGADLGAAESLLDRIERAGRFPGANIRRMKAVINFP
ncbi:MAG: hypothetical protein AAF762_02485 [Pseudomonadota bacterium]